VLAAFGIEAWLEAPSRRTRALMVAPGVAVWGALAVAFRPGLTFLLLGVGAVVGGAVLWAAKQHPALAVLLPLVLGGELVANGLMSFRPLPYEPAPALLLQLPAATIQTGTYVMPGAIVRDLHSLGPGRVIDLDLPGWRRLLADPLSTIFKVEQAGGYNPVELRRYWIFVRALTPRVLDHNLSIFYQPPRVLLDLLDVRFVVAPAFPLDGAFEGPLAGQGGAKLFAIRGAAPRATVLGSWRMASSPDDALQAVIAPGFDPQQTVVVESSGPPAHGSPGLEGTAAYTWLGTQGARVVVDARSPAMVLIRNPYAKGWHAQVDGVESKVSPADYVDQAVEVPAGRHVISLAYDDPTIGYGLLGSGLSLAGLLIALFVFARRRRGIERPPSAAAVVTEEPAQPGRSR